MSNTDSDTSPTHPLMRLDAMPCSRFFRDMDGDLGEQIEVDHLTNPMGEIWRRLKYRNGKTSWMPDRLLTEIHTYNKDACELYYATKAAYEDGYETAQQSCCEMMIRRERLLARWLEWARMHGHLEHAAGIVADTREMLPPQLLPENT